MKKLALAAACAAALCLAIPSAASAAPKVDWAPLDLSETAFIGVTVLPMDGRGALPGHTVVVRNGRIVGLGPDGPTPVPEGATTVDGRGRFLIPGLIDAHAHFAPGAGEAADSLGRQLRLSLANGATTVRGLIAAPGTIPVRDRAAKGAMTAPAMIVAGPSVNGNSAPNPEAARALVAKAAADGAEVIKTHGGMDRASYDAAVAEADRQGLPFVGHVTPGYGLMRAIEAGQDIEHLDGFIAAALHEGTPPPDGQFVLEEDILAKVEPVRFRDIARAMKARNTCNGPTLALFRVIAGPESVEDLSARPELRYAPAKAVEQWKAQKAEWAKDRTPGYDRFVALRDEAVRVLKAEGVPIIASGDSPHPFMLPGFSLRHEMDALVTAGLTPEEALAAATSTAARCLGDTGADIGVIAVGKRADLVLLDADPRRGLSALARPAGVMVRGKWISRPDLDALLSEVEASAKAS